MRLNNLERTMLTGDWVIMTPHAVSGQLSGRNGTLELEWHYDFPDEDAYYLDEDQYETLSVRAGKDVDGTPTLVANQGWGIKFEFALQP